MNAEADKAADGAPPRLEMRSISKSFGGVAALRDVDGDQNGLEQSRRRC